MKRKGMVACLAGVAGVVSAGAVFSTAALGQDTIKVGILHSLSGTMAISETTLKDTILMMIDAQNKKVGVGQNWSSSCGPAEPPLFAEKAAQCWRRTK